MVVSYIKVNDKTYTLEALSERFVHIPTRKFIEIFRHNNVVLPRLLRMILLRKYLTPCIQDPRTNSYFSKELTERLQYFEYFTEYQLEELLALLKEDIDYTLYVKDFWLDVLGMKDVLELSNGLLNLLDSQVDENFAEYNILTFNILTSHIFGDKYGFIDGVSTEQLRMILKKSSTVTTLRNIAKKYNVSLPQNMTRNFFANLVVAKYKEDPQYTTENLKKIADANIESLEEFANSRNYGITANDELGSYIEYVILKANVRFVNDIVYSGYVLSKKNSKDPFIVGLIETKSSESILDGSHIQLYTSHEDVFEDFEYDESLVAKMQVESDTLEETTYLSDNSTTGDLDSEMEDSDLKLDEITNNSDEGLLSLSSIDYDTSNLPESEQNSFDVINSDSSLIDDEEINEDSDQFDELFTEFMSLNDLELNQDVEQSQNTTEIIDLSKEIKNIDIVLSGRRQEDVIIAQIEEIPAVDDNIQIEETTDQVGDFDNVIDEIDEDSVFKLDEIDEDSEFMQDELDETDEYSEDDIKEISGIRDYFDIENEEISKIDDDFKIEIEDLNVEDVSVIDLDLDFDSSGASLDAVEQFNDFGNHIDDSELFMDEIDEGFNDIDIDALEFDRVVFSEDQISHELSDYDNPISKMRLEGVSQDLVIGQLDEVEFDYDELDITEARQISDFETVSSMMYTSEAIEPITVEDDSYDLNLDMKVDLTNERDNTDSGIDYNTAPELSVKMDNMSGNVFDIDIELPSNVSVPDRIGNEEETIQKSATLDAEFERFLREVDELKTTSVLEFDSDIGKYKFEVSEEDIQKLKKSGKSGTPSLDEKEDELLAALSDLD